MKAAVITRQLSRLDRRGFLKCAAVATASPLALPALTLADRPVEPSAQHCILINLVGGPSQLDTFDLKPNAPVEIRGPFRPIATNVPGIQITEMLPRIAATMNRIALVRSVYH